MKTNIYLICSIVLMFSYSQAFTQRFVPDTTINSILLLQDISSSILFYPNLDSSKINNDGELDFFKEEQPFVLFLNASKTEYLIAIIHEGTFEFYFAEFEIGKISDSTSQKLKIPYIVTQYKDFWTESHLCLGMTLGELEKIKGKNYIRKGNIIKYFINNDVSEFLKRYNMPEYFLECELSDNRVCKIRFGFTYP